MPGTSLPPASGAPVLNPPPGAPIYGTPQPSGGYPYPAPGNVVPSTGTTFAPSGTLNTGGSFGSSAIPTPADTVPALNVNPQTMQRPILDSLRGANDNGVISPERNAVLPGGVTLEPVNHRSALRRDWGYTPVRLASHSEPVRSSDSEPYSRVTEGIFSATSDVVLGQSESVPAAPATKDPNVNSHWRNAGW